MFKKILLLLALTNNAWAKKPLLIYIHECLYSCIGPTIQKKYKNNLILKPFTGGLLSLKLRQKIPDLIIGADYLEQKQILKISEKIPQSIYKNLFLPLKWNNDYAIPFAYMYVTFLFDSRHQQLINLESLSTMFAKLNKKSIIFADPRITILGRIGFFWCYDQLLQYKNSILSYPKGWLGAFNLFHKNPNLIMLGYTTSKIYYQKNNQPYIKPVLFTNHPHPIRIFTIVKPKNKNNTKKISELIKFLISHDIQKLLLNNYMYPVINLKLPIDFQQCIPPYKYIFNKTQKEYLKMSNEWLIANFK